MAKSATVTKIARAISDLRTKRFSYQGPSPEGEDVLPAGLSRVSCSDFIGIGFIDPADHNIVSMFSLEPGRIHVVRKPDSCIAVVECPSDTVWHVSYSNRFSQSDPTRIESTLVRPRSPKEEMQDYLNEVAARAAGERDAQLLRSGQAEFDMENDDYTEHYEDDAIAPLSVYQMEGMIKIMQEDLQEELSRKQRDIEEEAPPVALKAGVPAAPAAGNNNLSAAPAASADSEPPAPKSAK